jgi:hypothetical protein
MLGVGYFTLREIGGYHTGRDKTKVSEAIPITIGIMAAVVVLTVLSYLYRRRSRRRRTGDIPLTAISPGVHREVYGDDASDELPKYEAQSATDQVPQPLVRHGTMSEPPGYSVSVPLSPSVTTDSAATPMATSTAMLNPSAPGEQTSAST